MRTNSLHISAMNFSSNLNFINDLNLALLHNFLERERERERERDLNLQRY